jgi:hypothetical protein
MHSLRAFLAALLLAASPTLALAEAAGSAKGVNPAADVARDGGSTTLVVGADVFIGDLVETGPKGQVQILFADNTELVVGPNSALTIEDYLIRNDGSAGKLAVDMLSGAFRFSTGDSAKNRYVIKTPTGTIGVRGTSFDVVVQRALRRSLILLYDGALRFCTTAGDCEELSEFCELGQIAGDAEVLGLTQRIGGSLRDELKAAFIYEENQGALLRAFWVARARECLNSPPRDVESPDSGNLEGGPGVIDTPNPPPPPPDDPPPPPPPPPPPNNPPPRDPPPKPPCDGRDCR